MRKQGLRASLGQCRCRTVEGRHPSTTAFTWILDTVTAASRIVSRPSSSHGGRTERATTALPSRAGHERGRSWTRGDAGPGSDPDRPNRGGQLPRQAVESVVREEPSLDRHGWDELNVAEHSGVVVQIQGLDLVSDILRVGLELKRPAGRVSDAWAHTGDQIRVALCVHLCRGGGGLVTVQDKGPVRR